MLTHVIQNDVGRHRHKSVINRHVSWLFPPIIRDSRHTTVILRFDDAKLSCYNDAVRSHQIVIFIQVVTDAYP